MRRGYFLKKTILESGQNFALLLVKISVRFYRLVFAKRTILFVTSEKIRSVTLSPLCQACLFLVIAWVGNLFIESLNYHKVVSAKTDEINKLKSINDYFEEEITSVNDKLKKVNEYLISITGETHAVNAEERELRQPKNFKEEDLSKGDKHTFNQIKIAGEQIASIKSVAKTRIKKIENAISLTGLNIKKIPGNKLKTSTKIKEISLNGEMGIANRQGGPLERKILEKDSLEQAMKNSSLSDDDLERHLEKMKFVSEMDYLMVLEKLARVMPLSRPMKNYYISSGFGSRVDPITHSSAIHQGLDFVGSSKEKIISPSAGIVVLAGKFSDYGNAIVIDHGFGVTTRYGHLSEVRVKTGQLVGKGDVIALQGSTGRSTGAHLHYEVRYKNTPLNPKKFLEAGEALFNDEKISKHVNS